MTAAAPLSTTRSAARSTSTNALAAARQPSGGKDVKRADAADTVCKVKSAGVQGQHREGEDLPRAAMQTARDLGDPGADNAGTASSPWPSLTASGGTCFTLVVEPLPQRPIAFLPFLISRWRQRVVIPRVPG